MEATPVNPAASAARARATSWSMVIRICGRKTQNSSALFTATPRRHPAGGYDVVAAVTRVSRSEDIDGFAAGDNCWAPRLTACSLTITTRRNTSGLSAGPGQQPTGDDDALNLVRPLADDH